MNEPVETKPAVRRLNEHEQVRIEHVARMALRGAAIAREVHEGMTENPLPPHLVIEHLSRPWARRTDPAGVVVYGDTPGQPTHLVEGRLYLGARWSAVLDDRPGMTLLRSDLEVAQETPEAVEVAMVRASHADEVVERYLSMAVQLEALREELGFAFGLGLPPSSQNDLHTAWKDCEWAFAPAGPLACVAVYLGPGKIEQLVGHVSTCEGWTIVLSEGRPYLLRESLRMRSEGPEAEAVTTTVAVVPEPEEAPRSCRGCKFSGMDPDCDPFCTHPTVIAKNAYGLVIRAAVSDYCGAELKLFSPRKPQEDETCR